MNDLEILNIYDKNIETLISEYFCGIDFENDSVKCIWYFKSVGYWPSKM